MSAKTDILIHEDGTVQIFLGAGWSVAPHYQSTTIGHSIKVIVRRRLLYPGGSNVNQA